MWRGVVVVVAWVCAGQREEEQVHVTLGQSATELLVTWATRNESRQRAGSSVVHWRPRQEEEAWREVGSSSVERYSVVADGHWNLDYTSPWIHQARLSGLEADVWYQYRVDDGERREVKTVASEAQYPMTLAILGDLGQTGFSAETVQELASHEPRPELAFLVGDLSYADGDGARWDAWERLVTPLFASLPLVALPGNHEIEDEDGIAFKGYRARYPAGPAVADEIVAPGRVDYETYEMNVTYDYGASFYSFDVGGVHVIALNTYADTSRGSLQRAWLERDLYCLDRDKTPWVVVGMHAPWYSTNEKHRVDAEVASYRARDNLEDVIAAAPVAVVAAGHVHAYERSKPVCKGRVGSGPVYLTVGDGGNREQLYDHWSFGAQEPWSTFRNGTKYGFGTIEFANETHALWRWLPNHVDGPRDTVWLVQVEAHDCDVPKLPKFACDPDDVLGEVARRARRSSSSSASKKTGGGTAFTAARVVVALLVVAATLALALAVLIALRQACRGPRHPSRADRDAFFRRHNSDFSIVGLQMDDLDDDDLDFSKDDSASRELV